MDLAYKEIDRCTAQVRSRIEKLAQGAFTDSSVFVGTFHRPEENMPDNVNFAINISFKKRQDPTTALKEFEQRLGHTFASDDYAIAFETGSNIQPNTYHVAFRITGPVRRMAGDLFKQDMEARRADAIAERETLRGTRQEREKKLVPKGSKVPIPQQR